MRVEVCGFVSKHEDFRGGVYTSLWTLALMEMQPQGVCSITH